MNMTMTMNMNMSSVLNYSMCTHEIISLLHVNDPYSLVSLQYFSVHELQSRKSSGIHLLREKRRVSNPELARRQPFLSYCFFKSSI